ncbi:YbaB/EbfC family nucleoid-associated protein [Paracoccus sp. p4-l81]|uniref:YbaB/EbfC family nucleoid-associated protein n=1 Tax=unclassified Paracoccus (in: a-proteobacteria) TaxID=2688777 RepID=UPI0035B92528
MFKGLGAMGDMAKMMKAAKDMQAKMTKLQEDLDATIVQGEAGAGLIRAEATAKGELVSLKIDPSIFQAEDKEVVEDLILAAIKDVQRRAAEHTAREMGRIQTELGLPADMKLPI